MKGLEFSVIPLLKLGLKNKGTEEEIRAPVTWVSPLLSLKPPKYENQRRETTEGREIGRILGKDTGTVSVRRVGVCHEE